jgi:hypothetical protein
VIVGSSPSGTFATSRPIANVTASPIGRPAASVPTTKKITPAATATAAISWAARFTWRWSGLMSLFTRCESAAIRPSCVCMPVA